MKYNVVLEYCPDNSYFGYCDEFDDVMATGENREAVLQRIRDQILYQLEYCPCSFVKPERLKLNVEEKDGLCERQTAG